MAVLRAEALRQLAKPTKIPKRPRRKKGNRKP